MEQFLGSIPL